MKPNYNEDSDSIRKEPSVPEIGEMVGAGSMPGERPLITDRRVSPAPYTWRLKEFGKRVSRYLLEKLEKALDYPPNSYSPDVG